MIAGMNALLLSLLASPAAAHLALYHPSMYGFLPEDPWSWEQTKPLDGMAFKDWWFHGYLDKPPPEGVFMELPAGGVFTGEIGCNKLHTSYRKVTKENNGTDLPYMSCDTPGDNGAMGAIHATDIFPGPAYGESKSVKGVGLGIAYESDVGKLKPDSFVVISVNHSAPWTREVGFAIPAGLPPCPAGGCHCMWGWIPDPMNVQQMYTLGYRCNVTGQTGTEYPAKPQIPRKCPFDKRNCTMGAKQMLYQFQLEGNNIHQDRADSAFYNDEYGFHDGAQTDIWSLDDGATWNTNTSDLAPVPWETLSSVPWAPSQAPTWTTIPDTRPPPTGVPAVTGSASASASAPPTETPAETAIPSATSGPASVDPTSSETAAAPSATDASDTTSPSSSKSYKHTPPSWTKHASTGEPPSETAVTLSAYEHGAKPTKGHGPGKCHGKRRLKH